ncbi:MAG: hypothetical protein R3272_11950 [Candidatus Promineifilaceae bacterium]|nr:hypothetical protein [Candidatus Promineifilaceae bacterium]
MANFDWQTEDEQLWEAQDSAPLGTRGWMRHLLPVGLVLALLVVLGVVLYRMAQEQVETAEQEVTEHVLSSYQLLRVAAQGRDEELLLSLLSGREPVWTETQVALLQQRGGLFDRSALGLQALPLTGTEGVVDVILEPSLQEAVVTVEQPYAIDVGNGLTETVFLRHELIFRRGTSRWLYAPPEDEAAYWGERARYEGRSLALLYPTRDRALVRRLAADLDPLVAAGWVAAGLDYTPRALSVRLTADPRVLVTLNQYNALLQAAPQLTLPTPAVVGEPVDGAAYRALYRGYARHLVGHVLVTGTGYTCCDHDVFYTAALNHYLADIGLLPAPPPPTIPATDPFVNATPRLDELIRLSAVSGARTLLPAHRAALHGFVSFLVVEGIEPVEMLRVGALTPETLSLFFEDRSRQEIEVRWQQYMRNYILAQVG